MRYFACLLAIVCTSAFANLPYYPISFPRDEAAHYDNIPYTYNRMIEWWYFNGKVIADDGSHLSFDAVIFNGSVMMNGNVRRVPMIHFQIADLDKKRNVGVINRYPIGSGKISTDLLVAQLDQFNGLNKNGYVYHLQMQRRDEKFALALEFVARSEPLLISPTGYIDMGNNTSSYYYSIPSLTVEGQITFNGKKYHISDNNPQQTAWMDHQWGDFSVREVGWEFFSVRLENNLYANVFLNIDFQTQQAVGGLATIKLPNGKIVYVPFSKFKVQSDKPWTDPKTGVIYPQRFIFDFPELNLHLESNASFPEQSPTKYYWEGYCDVTAKFLDEQTKGFSITELVLSPQEAQKK